MTRLTRIPTVFDGLAPFASCPRLVRRQLAAHTDVLRPAPDAVLARRGAVAREVVVIVAGEVVLTREGRPPARLGPGQSFGGEEVLAGTPHRHTIVAGRDVELRVINGPAFLAAADHLPALAAPLPLPRSA